MGIDPDYTYRKRYQWALEQAGITDAPIWEDLSDEQRQNIRNEVHHYTCEMNDFGNSISKG